MGVGRTHRPPTLDEGVMEAKEEGSMGGRQMMGTKSWEAEAQEGRPGGGLGGMGGVPHITLSRSSVTYLREGQPQEGIQMINGSRTQEMALTMGEGKGRTIETNPGREPAFSQQDSLLEDQEAGPALLRPLGVEKSSQGPMEESEQCSTLKAK